MLHASKRTESLKQIAFFQILSPDILQLCNVMLQVDWLQVNVFLQFEHTREWHSFHVYMTTSVSAYDIIQITLNDNSSRY